MTDQAVLLALVGTVASALIAAISMCFYDDYVQTALSGPDEVDRFTFALLEERGQAKRLYNDRHEATVWEAQWQAALLTVTVCFWWMAALLIMTSPPLFTLMHVMVDIATLLALGLALVATTIMAGVMVDRCEMAVVQRAAMARAA